ncbi:hypothetical protein A2999_02885 [Candidatus Wolfebacteria bacterium RIFCSPLOWO2_01_FULL_38_11]|uniref:Uncharacterized protein n=2 Tax=Candidatus Wolfeibacteriota TaxID=1752735 RepID=A0A0G0GB43_9BACT|nr:MAG: hypothetical protein US36_C0002G0005 [Candidatus Wolfebacteria bacterium GW2011_GWC1_37_10]OGM91402.1 MAG: hypothetical protein A2999_02885 [Candidatus Wolfebacteria bacterium RIFCSPLOWO2_01_FULL_38_11]
MDTGGLISKLAELFELLVILISKLFGIMEDIFIWSFGNFAWIFEKVLQLMIDLVRFILNSF